MGAAAGAGEAGGWYDGAGGSYAAGAGEAGGAYDGADGVAGSFHDQLADPDCPPLAGAEAGAGGAYDGGA